MNSDCATPYSNSSKRRRLRPRRARLIGMVGLLTFATGCPPAEELPPPERPRVSLVRERENAARVEGVGPLAGFAKGRDCTLVHCLEVVLDALGRRFTYDELMGLSGMAFRTQFHVGPWDVGNPDPLVGNRRVDALFEAVGWEYELHIVRQDEIARAAALERTIRASIDRQVPVLATNLIPPEDWGIIVGYRRGRQWLCRCYHGGAERIDKPATAWPTAVLILTRRLARPASGPMRRQSLREAVTLFETRSTGSYAQGRHAFDEWCQSLRTARDRSYVHPNFWTYIELIDARGAAVRYLRLIAPDMGGKRLHLERAAELYEQEVRLLLRHLEDVPPEYRFPGSLPPREMRDRQIQVLQKAQRLEEQAVGALKNAM